MDLLLVPASPSDRTSPRHEVLRMGRNIRAVIPSDHPEIFK